MVRTRTHTTIKIDQCELVTFQIRHEQIQGTNWSQYVQRVYALDELRR